MGGPLGQLPLLPTGGVSLKNVDEFFAAGASGVGVGSSLVDGDAVEREAYGELTDRAAAFREAIDSARE
jgi:2-dehydro-3-deoxyphosphogluconate aldolase/(4S)-4-hydroxy-2-oxoglutarate aldolase